MKFGNFFPACWVLLFAWLQLQPNSGLAEPTKSITELGGGPPVLMDTVLHPSAYRVSTARELAKPQLMWLNFAWLRENGYKVPAEGVTPEFLKQLFKTLAYQIPGPNDPESAFLSGTIQIYADGYGADDTKNLGSGRAGSWKEVQVKGIGRTEHVRETNGHSSGAAEAAEGLKESYFGEIANNELSPGASRVIALFSTGTVVNDDGKIMPRVLVVRPDPVRPAQFIRNYRAELPADVAWDKTRVANVIGHLPDALPQPPGPVPTLPGPKLRAGLNEFAERTALQFADSYLYRLHHGAASVSNILINGATVDYGTFTGLAGWTKYLFTDAGTAFGDTGEPIQWILDQFITDLHKTIPDSLRSGLPTKEELRSKFKEAYNRLLPERMLKLTGAPDPLLEELKSKPEFRALGKSLIKLTEAGNEKVMPNWETEGLAHQDFGTYRVREIMDKLARGKELDQRDIADPVFRRRFSREYKRFFSILSEAGSRQGVATPALRTYMAEASEVITRKLPEIEHDGARFDGGWWDVWKKFSAQGNDRRYVQEYLDSRIENNIRNFKDAAPYEVVLHQKSDPEFGVSVRGVYNAQDGKYYRVIRVADSDGRSNFFGTILPTAELEGSELSLSGPKATPSATLGSAARRSGPYVEYRLETSRSFGVGQPTEALVLKTGTGKTIRVGDQMLQASLWNAGATCSSSFARSRSR